MKYKLEETCFPKWKASTKCAGFFSANCVLDNIEKRVIIVLEEIISSSFGMTDLFSGQW